MQTSLVRSKGNTIELTVTIPWEDIKKTYAEILDHLLEHVEVTGFRKGKAPREVALKQIDQTKVYEEVLKQIVPKVYNDAIKSQNVTPILSPKVELLEASENKDWKLKATTCEKPKIDVGNYKQATQKAITAKKGKIWVPGQDKEEKKSEGPTVGEILEALYTEIKVELSDLMVEQQVTRELAHLFDELKKLGLTVEQYLQSQNKTSAALREEYTKMAEKNLSLEFALEEIADFEKVVISDSDIEAFIKTAKSPEEREALEKQRYFVGNLLRRQKTLELLTKPTVVTI